MTLASEVDVLTNSLYAGKKFRGELGSLACLFTDHYWEGIAKVLRKTYGAVPHGPSVKSSQSTIDIGVGWIDKGPYAQFNPSLGAIDQRVEIADATLVYVRRNWQKNISARCVVLQAKVGHGVPRLCRSPRNQPTPTTVRTRSWPSWLDGQSLTCGRRQPAGPSHWPVIFRSPQPRE